MASKKGKKNTEEEERLHLEEMERLRKEEAIRLKAEAREARLNELWSELRNQRFDNETRLVSSFNNYLEDKENGNISRKKEEIWDRWMDQNGRPDLLSVQSVSAFISECIDKKADEESVLGEYRLVNDLISEVKKLTLDYPDKISQFNEAIEQLNAMKDKRIDQMTLQYLKNSSAYTDDQSGDLFREFKDDQSGLEYMVWANLSKNSRRRNVAFKSTGVEVELTKDQCKDDAGLRVFFTEEDNFNVLMPEKLDPSPFPEPVEQIDEPDVEPEEEGNEASATSIGTKPDEPQNDLEPPAAKASKLASKATSRATSRVSALAASEVEDIEAESEESLKPEKFGLDGKDGVGGVWHIDFLKVPDPPKRLNNWTIQRFYENELQTTDLKLMDPNKGVQVVLPIPEGVTDNKSLAVGIWNRQTREWVSDEINISEQKDGSVYFNTKKMGAFRFFIDRHENDDKPLVETWLLRPNKDIVEFHLILQNYRLVFEVLPDGNVNLIEQHEPKILKTEQTNVDIEELLLRMEEQSLFVFPTEKSLQYLDYINKDEFVTCRTYQNMCSISQCNEFKMSPYNPTLPNGRLAMVANQKTLLCTEDRFYVIEDSYIPPEPPVAPTYATPEDEEADEVFKEEMQKYEEKIKEEEENFEPDFEISREGEPMQATLDACLGCECRINEQNLTVYKLLLKSKIFNF